MISSSPMLFLATLAAFFLCGVFSRPPMGDERDVPTAIFRGVLHVIQQQNDGGKHPNKREVTVVDGENNSEENMTTEKLLEKISINFFGQLFAGTKDSNVNAIANNDANNGPSHHRRRRRHLIPPAAEAAVDDPNIVLAQKKLNDHKEVYMQCMSLTRRWINFLFEMKWDPSEAHKLRDMVLHLAAMKQSVCNVSELILYYADEALNKAEDGEKKTEIRKQIADCEAQIAEDKNETAKAINEINKPNKGKKRG